MSQEDIPMNRPQIDPQVSIGHVHLKVADLERALNFYCGVLGFGLTQRYGSEAAFISPHGMLAMFTRPLDLNALLDEV